MGIKHLSPREEAVRLNLKALQKHLGFSRVDFAIALQMPIHSLKNYQLGYRTTSLGCLQSIGATYGYALAGRMVEPKPITTEEFNSLIQEVAHD